MDQLVAAAVVLAKIDLLWEALLNAQGDVIKIYMLLLFDLGCVRVYIQWMHCLANFLLPSTFNALQALLGGPLVLDTELHALLLVSFGGDYELGQRTLILLVTVPTVADDLLGVLVALTIVDA